MPYRILLRRDLSQNWNYNDPVLMSGEPGYEMDTRKLKLGDGQTPWSQLPYYAGATGPSGPIGPMGLPDSLYSLPVPKVSIQMGASGPVNLPTISGGTGATGATGADFQLINHPVISPMNITQDQIDAGIWIEMVYNRPKRGKKSSSGLFTTTKGFAPFNSQVNNINTLTRDIISLNPGTTPAFSTRGGIHLGNIDRFNHFRIENKAKMVDVSQYFYGLFSYAQVEYSQATQSSASIQCLVPGIRHTNINSNIGRFGKRYFYARAYKPLYVKFRYIMWNPNANSHKGEFVSGPFSETIKLTQPVHPFLCDYESSQISVTHNGGVVGKINPAYAGRSTQIKCWIEDDTP
jgi:hypothetical protein